MLFSTSRIIGFQQKYFHCHSTDHNNHKFTARSNVRHSPSLFGSHTPNLFLFWIFYLHYFFGSDCRDWVCYLHIQFCFEKDIFLHFNSEMRTWSVGALLLCFGWFCVAFCLGLKVYPSVIYIQILPVCMSVAYMNWYAQSILLRPSDKLGYVFGINIKEGSVFYQNFMFYMSLNKVAVEPRLRRRQHQIKAAASQVIICWRQSWAVD